MPGSTLNGMLPRCPGSTVLYCHVPNAGVGSPATPENITAAMAMEEAQVACEVSVVLAALTSRCHRHTTFCRGSSPGSDDGRRPPPGWRVQRGVRQHRRPQPETPRPVRCPHGITFATYLTWSAATCHSPATTRPPPKDSAAKARPQIPYPQNRGFDMMPELLSLAVADGLALIFSTIGDGRIFVIVFFVS